MSGKNEGTKPKISNQSQQITPKGTDTVKREKVNGRGEKRVYLGKKNRDK